jgi:hypothetical protein
LGPWNGLGVHGVLLDRSSHLGEGVLEQAEQGGLSGSARPDDDDAHALLQLLVQLDRLVDLEVDKLVGGMKEDQFIFFNLKLLFLTGANVIKLSETVSYDISGAPL